MINQIIFEVLILNNTSIRTHVMNENITKYMINNITYKKEVFIRSYSLHNAPIFT